MRSPIIPGARGSLPLRLAIAVEDLLQRAVLAVLGRTGSRGVAVLPFVGHGSPDRVHVRARIVLGPPTVADQSGGAGSPVRAERRSAAGSTAAGAAAGSTASGAAAGGPGVGGGGRRRAWRTLGRSLARFLTVELPGADVTVHVPAGPIVVTGDREGYVDAVLDRPGLAPGWHDVPLTATWRGRSGKAIARVLVLSPDARLAVVSDVDDTVIETGLTRGLAFLRLTLLTEVADRAPLAGVAALYRALAAGPGSPGGPRGQAVRCGQAGPAGPVRPGAPGAPVGPGAPGGPVGTGGAGGPGGPGVPLFYLSTSPWNLHDLLLEFIALRKIPAGPLLLTDWGPGRGALFRIPAEQHKLTFVRQLLADHPQVRLVLVGDTGQVDPEIYAAVAAEAPDRIAAIYIRRTPGMPAERARAVARIAGTVSGSGVPMLVVDDSVKIAEHAYEIGLIDRLAVAAVRSDSME